MSSIPDDLHLEILIRVPARSTFVCKCVCKTWLALISNPDFVKSHLNLAIHIILRGSNKVNCLIDHDSLLSPTHLNTVNIRFPFQHFDSGAILLSSCNGLLCIWCINRDDTESLFCLWNAATSEYKEVPKSPDELGYGNAALIAFGYDSKADDYKLLQVKCSLLDSHVSRVQVYTLRSDSWETIQNFPYYYTRVEYRGVLLDGVFHWLGNTHYNQSPSNVKFGELQLPALEKKHLFMGVGELEGCLCVLVHVNEICFQVWVMQEYGVEESWSKRYTIDYGRVMYYRSVRLILSFKSGEILFQFCGGDPVLYDPKYGSVRELSISGVGRLYEGVNYFESLVPLNSGTYICRQKDKPRLCYTW